MCGTRTPQRRPARDLLIGMEGDPDPFANIPPDKPISSSVNADVVTTKSETAEPIRNAGNTTVTKESEPAKCNGDTGLESIVSDDRSDSDSSNDEKFVYRDGLQMVMSSLGKLKNVVEKFKKISY